MTLHQLKVFVTVAKLRSFTLAGEDLHISQSSVSSVVSELAREMGAKLFEKLGNKIRLTTVGEGLLPRFEEILSKVERTKEEVGEILGLKKGKLFLGGTSLAAASFLPMAMQAFKKDHPYIDVILRIDRTGVLEKKLLDGDLDIAILGQPPRSNLLNSDLYHEEDVAVIVHPKHPLTRKRFTPLELIAQEPLILHNRGGWVRDEIELRFAERQLPFAPLLEIPLGAGSRDAIRKAVISGLGIGFLSKHYVLSDLEAGRLKLLKVPDFAVKRRLYIAIHKDRKVPTFCQEFVTLLKTSSASQWQRTHKRPRQHRNMRQAC